MAIQHSVGTKGKNNRVDAKVIQAALNLAQSTNFKLKNRLIVDGKIGKNTVTAIENFQKNIVTLSNPDGRVDAGGTTLKTLKKNITKGLNQDSLSAIMAMGTLSAIHT